MFRKDDTRDFRLVQNITLGESDLSIFVRLRNQPAVMAEQFGREQSLSLIQITTMSNDTEKQLKPVHKVVDFVDRPYRKICVTAAIYCGQAREFLCSNPNICNKGGRGRVSTFFKCNL